MDESTHALLLDQVKEAWEVKYSEKSYPMRWTQSDERKEPKRQRDVDEGKKKPAKEPVKEPVWQEGQKWMFVAPPNPGREIITIEKMAEKVFVEYLPARDKGTSQKDFCKEFRIRYEGARSQDVEFITRVMEQSLRSSELKAKEDEESAEGEPNTKVKERSTISTATRSPAAPTTTKLSKKEEEKKKKKKKDKKKEQKPEKAGQSTAPPPEPTTPSPPTPTNPSSSHSKVQKETRKDAEASEKEPSPRKEAKMAEPEPKSVPELEEEEQEGDDNDGDGGNDEDGIGPKPPSDPETEEGTIKIIEPWFPEPSKKGGMKWKIVYEVTLANGEKERRVDYDHKDEQIGHIKNYRRHPKWEAIYESRRR